jgi:hypothetical protein
MESTQSVANPNPLAKHFRQPAIYFRLPSGGRYWQDGALTLPINGEIPVYPMTARDEITLRTPDALLNGQGVVDVIQSCCPNIINAWGMPSIDVDAVLIAMRMASYGDSMDVDTACPHCQEEHSHSVSLSRLLASRSAPDYSAKIEFDGFSIKFKPQHYFSVNRTDQIRFEEQRLIAEITDTSVSEELRVVKFSQHMDKIVNLNLQILTDSTDYISLQDGTMVNNTEYLNEFYNNCETKIVNQLQQHLSQLLESSRFKEIAAQCNSCDKDYLFPLLFDYASFFAKGS